MRYGTGIGEYPEACEWEVAWRVHRKDEIQEWEKKKRKKKSCGMETVLSRLLHHLLLVPFIPLPFYSSCLLLSFLLGFCDLYLSSFFCFLMALVI